MKTLLAFLLSLPLFGQYTPPSGTGGGGASPAGPPHAVQANAGGGLLEGSSEFLANPYSKNVTIAGVSALVVTVTPTLGGSTEYEYYVIAHFADNATTDAGAETDITTGAAVLDSTHYNTLTWVAPLGSTNCDVYTDFRDGTPSSLGKLGTVVCSTQTFRDNGVAGDGTIVYPNNTTGSLQVAGLFSFGGRTPIVQDSNGVVILPTVPTPGGDSFVAGVIDGAGYDPTTIHHVVLFGSATESIESNGLIGLGFGLTVGAHLCTVMGYTANCTGDQAFAFGRASVSSPGNIAFGDGASDGGFGDVVIFANGATPGSAQPLATAAHQILLGSRVSTALYWGDPGSSNVVTFHQGGHAGITCTSTGAVITRIEGGIITDATCP